VEVNRQLGTSLASDVLGGGDPTQILAAIHPSSRACSSIQVRQSDKEVYVRRVISGFFALLAIACMVFGGVFLWGMCIAYGPAADAAVGPGEPGLLQWGILFGLLGGMGLSGFLSWLIHPDT